VRVSLLVAIAALVTTAAIGQHDIHPNEPLTAPDPVLRQSLRLIRQGKTDDARKQ
jgi:hypothetical protein